MLLEFHAANLSTKLDTIVFIATWLSVDANRYSNVADSGLPRFAWLADLNDQDLNQGDAVWARWTTDGALEATVELDLAQLTDDLQTVRSAWRAQAGESIDLLRPPRRPPRCAPRRGRSRRRWPPA